VLRDERGNKKGGARENKEGIRGTEG